MGLRRAPPELSLARFPSRKCPRYSGRLLCCAPAPVNAPTVPAGSSSVTSAPGQGSANRRMAPWDLRALEAVSSPLWSGGAREGSRPNTPPGLSSHLQKGATQKPKGAHQGATRGAKQIHRGLRAQENTPTHEQRFLCVCVNLIIQIFIYTVRKNLLIFISAQAPRPHHNRHQLAYYPPR